VATARTARRLSTWGAGPRDGVSALLVAAVTVALSAELPGIARGGGSPAGDDVEMVEIAAGTFAMGSADSEADRDEQPVARVFVDTFWIDCRPGLPARPGSRCSLRPLACREWRRPWKCQ
jgi:formylglycine-generating enzyme required for sulfatase activity